MPSEKDRLYIALYARGGAPTMAGLEDTYHWAFIVGPKTESSNSRGSRFHAKEGLVFAGDPPTAQASADFERTPLRPDQEGWNCVGWIKEALQAAIGDGRALGTCARDWESVRDTVMWYVEAKKAAHRFDGTVPYDPTKAATWDMLESAELAP
ncbi:hypothetical protein HRG_005411 [Hirsutella rhossiliensis]|uniref:Uncharacterized protein n=1 Tax=Hirsutella rhossiliensis TaxID=111463 RepID=A0A9P8SJC1_9HYPO|nr:uncharacterized protein HRG_05411 [Hirsutella rhossiliensis]KAH0962901.1 hypothetical protein HRG_05411 [Hirsutella rhossiliensis]